MRTGNVADGPASAGGRGTLRIRGVFTGNRRPAAADVAARLSILYHVTVYSRVLPPPGDREHVLDGRPEAEAQALVSTFEQVRSRHWQNLRNSKTWAAMSPSERRLAECPPLEIPVQEFVNAFWRVEGVVVLAWALKLLDALPPYDLQASDDALKAVGLALSERDPRQLDLRPAAQIDKARDLAEFWHWRARTRQLIEMGPPLEAGPEYDAADIRSYDDIVRQAAKHAAEKGDFVAIDEDFPALGKAYRDLTADEYQCVYSIVRERHFALNWLCGMAPGNRWDKTPLST